MRITTLYIGIQVCFTSVLLAGSLKAQGIRIDMRQASIKQVFNNIEKQSKVTFVYDDRILDGLQKITIKTVNGTLPDVLKLISTQVPLQFHQTGKVIGVIRTDTKTPALLQPNRKSTGNKPPLTVTGKITDGSGLPLAGATVRVKNTRLSASTDVNGIFSIEDVPDTATLIVTYVGYITKEVPVNGNAVLRIALLQDEATLKEVVVSTGYQTLPKERATGSFVKIDSSTFNREVSTDVVSRLNGIASGVLFDQRSGNQQTFNVRGRSTILANDNPLIVVDNFPYDGDINNINPNDVESITILKDAAAASIWGVRAGNGVLVITTKKGKHNQPLKIDWNSNVTIGNKPNLFYNPNFLDAADFINVEKGLFAQGFYDGNLNNTITYPVVSPVVQLLSDERSGTISAADANAQIDALSKHDVRDDLEKYFLRKSVSQQYALNFSGGSSKATYMFSAGYDNDQQNQIDNNYSRLNLSSYTTFTPLKGLDITTGLYYVQSQTSVSPQNYTSLSIAGTTNSFYPYAQLADANGNPLPIPDNYRLSYIQSLNQQGQLLDWEERPLQDARAANNKTFSSEIRFDPSIRYTIIPGLSAEVKYQYERSVGQNNNDQSIQSFFTRDLINEYTSITDGEVNNPIPVGDILDQSTSTLTSNTFRGQLNFNRDFSKSNITAIAGTEIKQLTGEIDNNRLYGYNPSLGTNNSALDYTTYFPFYISGIGSIPYVDENESTTNRYLSYFGNAAYTYDNKYILSGSARIDKSNLFGVKTNQKSVPLWSVGLGWNISKEGFYHISWLPYLKLRATYGYSGNVDPTVTAVTVGQYSTDFYTNAQQVSIINPGNPELQWEKIGQYNFGADFATKNDIITGSAEYYTKIGSDLMGYASVDPTTGIITGNNQSVIKGNFASLKSHGVDVQLNFREFDRTFKWTTNLLFSYNKDEVTKYDQTTTALNYVIFGSGSDGNQTYPFVGYPVNAIYSFKWAGLDHNTGDPLGYINGQVSKDYTALTTVSPDQLVYNGPALPPIFGSIRNTFSWKQYSLSTNISYRFGYYFRKPSINYSNLYNYWGGNVDYLKRWQKPGDELNTYVPSAPTLPLNPNRDLFYEYSQVLVERADNIRMQDIQFSYTLDKNQWRAMPFNRLQLYLYANNIGILWRANKSGLDPDLFTGTLPLPFTISFGIRGNF